MNNYDLLQMILNHLMNADISVITTDNIMKCNEIALDILNRKVLTEYDINNMNMLISISQILYNNTDRSLLVLDDGVYDLLLEKDKLYNPDVQVGAPPIEFTPEGEIINKSNLINPIEVLSESHINDPNYLNTFLFASNIYGAIPYYPNINNREINRNKPIPDNPPIRTNVPHNYPKLVGTLDKCKFTLNKEAKERGVYDDPNVKIFERDFLGKHLQMGLFGPNDIIELDLELKYDGISVEADVTDHIISARTRGDTNNDLAVDLTPIFGGYRFPFCPELSDSDPIGMKFEAIITHANLERLSRLKNREYANGRNAVIGVLGSNDAINYADLITLVPLASSIEDLDRVAEIEFINKYYHSGEKLRYAIVRGTYENVLYQVYKFVKEAEEIRNVMPFMYDGVVVNYTDPVIINRLGRENFVNKYSMAIKFNTMIRQAVFTGYTYTVGQNGVVTPMCHYTPVEFYGGIHTKSSGHSYKRFKELNLAIGDVVELEYVNDVMPYLRKSNQPNWGSKNPPVEFPSECPCCGTKLYFTEKEAICTNIECPERIANMMGNMTKKLNFKDFSTESLRAIGVKSFNELMNLDINKASVLGTINSQKIINRIEEFKNTPIEDYKVLGAIGFSNIASETWKKILNVITLDEIINLDNYNLYNKLISIKGIGETIANNIILERNNRYDDLTMISSMPNIIRTTGTKLKTIRFTGVRDQDLCNYINSLGGYDANGNAGVTKTTDILIVPYDGYSSSKVSKAGPNTIIMSIDEFKNNINKIL